MRLTVELTTDSPSVGWDYCRNTRRVHALVGRPGVGAGRGTVNDDAYRCRYGFHHPVITLAAECSGVSHGIEPEVDEEHDAA